MEIVINQPFNLDATLKCGQGHRWLKEQGNNGWYENVVSGHIVRIRQIGDVDDKRNVVEFFSPWADAKTEAFLRWHFRLDDYIKDIYGCLSNGDPIMAELVNFYCGLRVMRIEPWECLVFFILSVRSPISRAQDNIERLSDQFSSPVNLDHARRRAFPNCGNLAGAGLWELKELLVGLSDYGPRVHQAAEAVSSKWIDLDALTKMSYSQVIKELNRLNGVGPKVANCVALFSLDKLEAFPVDTHIHKALMRLYREVPEFPHPKRPEAAGLRNWVQKRFGKYAGYASQFLFIDQYRST